VLCMIVRSCGDMGLYDTCDSLLLATANDLRCVLDYNLCNKYTINKACSSYVRHGRTRKCYPVLYSELFYNCQGLESTSEIITG